MGDDKSPGGNKNTKKRKDIGLSPINFLDDSDDDEVYSDYFGIRAIEDKKEEVFDDSTFELEKVNMDVSNLTDLINLAKKYDNTKRYEFNLRKLNQMIPSMERINNFIGLESIKNHLVDHILFFLQKDKLHITNDLMHTVITGPPGVGKTEFAKALGQLYSEMGILSSNKFKKVTRSDLVAKYLGQTAVKTRDLIKTCKGGVMFIDEVYSLGNKELRDSFSKEAIDTLNEHLTEMKDDLICIVAGYKDEVDNCFFAYNQGLDSRFPIRFHIEGYDSKELYEIFKSKVYDSKWVLADDVLINKEKFFEKNYKKFPNYGRDIDNLISQIKRCHSRRVFTLNDTHKTIITKEDMEKGLKTFLSFKSNNKKRKLTHNSMYI